MPIRTVVGGVLLAADQQLGVEELAVGASSDLVDGRGVQVDEDGTRDVFAAASLGEESLVRARLTKLLRIGVGAAIRQQAVLEEVAEGYRVSLGMANLGGRCASKFAITYSSQALLPSWVPAWPM